MTKLSRREAIGHMAGVGVGITAALATPENVGLASTGAHQSAPANVPRIPNWKTELRQLAPNVYAYIQAGGPEGYQAFRKTSRFQYDNGAVSNAGVIVGPDSLMAIDALGAPLHTKAFIAAARKTTGKSFSRLVNTHHHGDHTNGNQFFLPAEIVAHEFCRQAVITRGAAIKPGAKWEKREAWAEGAEDRIVAPPATTFSDKQTYRFGDTIVELIFVGPAHTYGDVVAYLPQEKILFGGDVVFHYVTPAVQNGHVTKWIETMDKLLAMDIKTVVPGHGPLGGKREMAETREYFVIQKREARKRFDAGMGPGKAAADIDMGKFEGWTNPDRAAWNLCRLYEEFSGTITPVTNRRAQREAVEEYMTLRAARTP